MATESLRHQGLEDENEERFTQHREKESNRQMKMQEVNPLTSELNRANTTTIRIIM